MKLELSNSPHTDVLRRGSVFVVTPNVSGPIHVTAGGGLIHDEAVTKATIYGPFLVDVPFKFDCVVAGAVGGGDITQTEDGKEVMRIGAQRWEDLRFPAQAINPVGAVGDPDIITDPSDYFACLQFAGGQDNIIGGVVQMPHSWKSGSPIRPHIHWKKDTGSALAVSWQLYYRHAGGPGDAPGAWSAPIAGVIEAGSQLMANQHLISTFGDIDMTGKAESSILLWKVERLGATDADNATVTLLEFDIHYQVSKNGTRNEFSDF